LTGLHERRSGDHDLLRSVVVFSTFTLVLGSLNFGFFVGGVQVLNNIRVEFLNLFLEWGQALDFARIHTRREGLRGNLLFNGSFDRGHWHVRDAAIVQTLLEVVSLSVVRRSGTI
jgi:hypothetical protein